MLQRMWSLIVIIATVSAALAQTRERVPVVKTNKLILNASTSAVMMGRWKLIGTRDPDFSLARLNSTYMRCSKTAMTCEEEVAELRTQSDGERLGVNEGELLATCHGYEIKEWTDGHLVAVSHKAVADLTVRIDFKNETAERVFREQGNPKKASRYILE